MMLNSQPPFARVQSYMMDLMLVVGITSRVGCAEEVLVRFREPDLVSTGRPAFSSFRCYFTSFFIVERDRGDVKSLRDIHIY